MKAILMSIKPKYVAKILNGEKTIEVRKRFPKNYRGWVYIYCTKGKETLVINPYGGYALVPNKYENEYFNGKVVARFYCDNVEEIYCNWHDIAGNCYDAETFYEPELLKKSCLSYEELDKYLQGENGYAIHISQLEIFDKPKELSEFKQYKKYNLADYNIPKLPKKHTWESLQVVSKAPQSMMYIEVEE